MRNLTKNKTGFFLVVSGCDPKAKNSFYSCLCFQLALSSLCKTFDTVSPNIDQAPLVISPANEFASEDF